MKIEVPHPLLLDTVKALLILTFFCEVFGLFDLAISHWVDSPNSLVGQFWMGFLNLAASAAPAFMFMAMATSLYWLYEYIPGLATHVDKTLTKLKDTVDDSKIDIVNEFVRQMKQGARFVDVGHELQIKSLYKDAKHICAHYPVHTVLRDSPALRDLLADTMAKETFTTYDMIVGPTGYRHLEETFDKWCQQIESLVRDSNEECAKEEAQRLMVFLEKIKVRRNDAINEIRKIRLSFFYVVLPDGMSRRGVIYIWSEPFGYKFNRVGGALIIEGESGYLNTLYGMFAKAWTSRESQDVSLQLRKYVLPKLVAAMTARS